MSILNRFQHRRLLSEVSTFGIGGPARFFVEIDQIAELQEIIAYCQEQQLRYFVLGKGSNVLFDDRGFDGLVIGNKISFCHREKGLVRVGAGYSFSLLGVQTARQGWAGLEFASGIPGSVGGAIYMNAGAGGSETKDCLESVDYVDGSGKQMTLYKEQLFFGYRTSSFQTMTGVIASATFILHPSEKARNAQLTLISYRKQTQPYSEKSAGCAFRNPKGYSAGDLIERVGLKGIAIGGALISSLHANFIVNRGGASSKDVVHLMELISKTIRDKHGIELEPEIRLIPYSPIF